jgi:hypothetical protein
MKRMQQLMASEKAERPVLLPDGQTRYNLTPGELGLDACTSP